MNQHVQLADVLLQLECELRRLHLWQDLPPSAQALASELPFAVDTLEFHQWLQFVLLPKLQHLILVEAQLPSACNISAYAEEVYQTSAPIPLALMAVIKRLDDTLNRRF